MISYSIAAAGTGRSNPDAPPTQAGENTLCRGWRVYQIVGVRMNLFADDAGNRTVANEAIDLRYGCFRGHPLASTILESVSF